MSGHVWQAHSLKKNFNCTAVFQIFSVPNVDFFLEVFEENPLKSNVLCVIFRVTSADTVSLLALPLNTLLVTSRTTLLAWHLTVQQWL